MTLIRGLALALGLGLESKFVGLNQTFLRPPELTIFRGTETPRAVLDPTFNHEKLEVYRIARLFNREIKELLESLPRGHSDSRDNLKRGAMSITRNIAEGSGKWTIRDKVNFYHIARGSATECAACLDELVDFGLVLEERILAPKHILLRVVAMLTAMIRSLEARGAADMR